MCRVVDYRNFDDLFVQFCANFLRRPSRKCQDILTILMDMYDYTLKTPTYVFNYISSILWSVYIVAVIGSYFTVSQFRVGYSHWEALQKQS